MGNSIIVSADPGQVKIKKAGDPVDFDESACRKGWARTMSETSTATPTSLGSVSTEDDLMSKSSDEEEKRSLAKARKESEEEHLALAMARSTEEPSGMMAGALPSRMVTIEESNFERVSTPTKDDGKVLRAGKFVSLPPPPERAGWWQGECRPTDNEAMPAKEMLSPTTKPLNLNEAPSSNMLVAIIRFFTGCQPSDIAPSLFSPEGASHEAYPVYDHLTWMTSCRTKPRRRRQAK